MEDDSFFRAADLGSHREPGSIKRGRKKEGGGKESGGGENIQ